MRERREIIKLAGQLQQSGALTPATLAAFITEKRLNAEEVAMLQGEFMSNVAVLFSVQQASEFLGPAPVARTIPAPRVPTLAELPELAAAALARGVYLAGNRRKSTKFIPGLLPGGPVAVFFNAADTLFHEDTVRYPLSRLYPFYYDPMAAGQVRAGSLVRYYHPGEGLDLTSVDHVAQIMEENGSLRLASGQLIPVAFVLAILDKI